MKVSFTQPEQQLSPYVALIWVFESSSGVPLADSRIIVPDGRAKIIVPYQNSLCAAVSHRLLNAQEHQIFLVGIQSNPTTIASTVTDTGTIGVELTPKGLYHLFKLSMHELTNRMVSFEELFGPQGARLQSCSRASCGFRKCTRDGCSTSHQPSFATIGQRTIMISLTSLKSFSALPDLRPNTTLASSMSLAEPSPPGNSSLFYNTSLPTLAYTYSRAITELARRERDTMLPEDRKRTAHRTLVTRVLEGDGRASRASRRAAFENAGLAEPLRSLIDKVAREPTRVTNEDVAAVLASGASEDQLFELVVCAAIGQATRQYETALDALADAMTGEKGSEHASEDPH